MASGAGAGAAGCYHGGGTGSNNAMPSIDCFQRRTPTWGRLGYLERLTMSPIARRASLLWEGRQPVLDCRLACGGLVLVDEVRGDGALRPPSGRAFIAARSAPCGTGPSACRRRVSCEREREENRLLPRPSIREKYKREQRNRATARSAPRFVPR